jgi:hypothetical protein
MLRDSFDPFSRWHQHHFADRRERHPAHHCAPRQPQGADQWRQPGRHSRARDLRHADPDVDVMQPRRMPRSTPCRRNEKPVVDAVGAPGVGNDPDSANTKRPSAFVDEDGKIVDGDRAASSGFLAKPTPWALLAVVDWQRISERISFGDWPVWAPSARLQPSQRAWRAPHNWDLAPVAGAAAAASTRERWVHPWRRRLCSRTTSEISGSAPVTSSAAT